MIAHIIYQIYTTVLGRVFCMNVQLTTDGLCESHHAVCAWMKREKTTEYVREMHVYSPTEETGWKRCEMVHNKTSKKFILRDK